MTGTSKGKPRGSGNGLTGGVSLVALVSEALPPPAEVGSAAQLKKPVPNLDAGWRPHSVATKRVSELLVLRLVRRFEPERVAAHGRTAGIRFILVT